MDNCCEGTTCTLNFLKHDWFEKGNDQIAIHIYVKNVSDCSVNFQEDCIVIQFRTSNEQFLMIHGPKPADIVPVTFVYSITTSGKILPDQCSYTVSNTRIDLKIAKAIPNRWVSLEAKKAVIDRKKAFDVKRVIPDMNGSISENPRKSSTDNSVSDSSNDVTLDKKDTEVSGPSWVKGSQSQTGFRSPENMVLLGGKSTPVSKKSNDTEGKVEKEAVMCSEPQASAAARESSSLKNVNKAIATGLTGLENYANNCYMNVAIQVLANIPEIRDYFMDDNFLNSLNINNPLSSGGRVARAFSDVIKALWSERKRLVKPNDLKNIMSKRCSSFLGLQQCDAQEFFCTLLENLHEDMNHGIRTDKSNESSHKESDGPSVNEKADTAWNEHSKRHDSLIIKMFHGQMVSKLTCLSCHKRSTTYEICAQISLPITMSKFRLPVTVFFRDHSRLPERLRLQISSPSAQLWHLLNVLERHIGIPAHCLRVCHDNKVPFGHAFNDDTSLTSIRNLKQIIVCEVKDDKETDFVSLPFRQSISDPSKLSTCPICNKTQNDTETKLKRCTKCMSVAYCSRECQSKHWPEHSRDCRKGFKAPVGLPFYVTISKHKLNFESLAVDALHYANYSVGIIEKEAEHFDAEPEEKRPSKSEAALNVVPKLSEKLSRMSGLSDGDQDEKKQALKMEGPLSSGSKNSDNNSKLRDVDKEEKNRQMRMEGASNFSTNSYDDFVIKAYLKADQDAILIYPDDFKLDIITSAEFLAIEWQKDCIKERDSKELNTPFKTVQGCLSDDQYGDRCSIGDCFSLFLEPEKLSEKDGWKCPKCKTVQAVKKEMALSYPPPILLVHFKRFTYGSYGEKVTKGINYPISGLDLSHYITEETKNVLSSHPIYDLFGVICHKGTMGAGHYTCMVRCLNQQGQPDIGWRYFDDDNVAKIGDERVCDSSAYVLVYRMRGTVQALKTECPFVVSPLQVNEGCQERSRAAARAPARQISTDNDSDTGSKPQFFDNGMAKGDARQSERKHDSDQKEARIHAHGPKALGSSDKSTPELIEEDFSEDSFEMANDREFVFAGISKQQCTREREEVENIKEVDSVKRHSTFDSNRKAHVETATVDTVGGNYYEESETSYLLVEDTATRGDEIPRVPGPLDNQSSAKEPVQSPSTTKVLEEDEEEYFFLAQSNVKPFDLAEVTENDLD